MELLWLLGIGWLLWMLYGTSRRMQAQLNLLSRQIEQQNLRLQQAFNQIDQLRRAAPATTTAAAGAPPMTEA